MRLRYFGATLALLCTTACFTNFEKVFTEPVVGFDSVAVVNCSASPGYVFHRALVANAPWKFSGQVSGYAAPGGCHQGAAMASAVDVDLSNEDEEVRVMLQADGCIALNPEGNCNFASATFAGNDDGPAKVYVVE